MGRSKTKNLVLCAVFTALIAVGAFLTVPIPLVPLTLQDMFTMLAGILLGPKLGTLSVCCYLLLGLIGFPIFTHGGGIMYVLQPSFGFLLGFIPGTYLTGWIARRSDEPGFKRLFLANLAGIGVIYVFGTVYLYLLNRFYLGNSIALWPMILACDIQPLPGDIIKSILAAEIGRRLLPIVKNEIL